GNLDYDRRHSIGDRQRPRAHPTLRPQSRNQYITRGTHQPIQRRPAGGSRRTDGARTLRPSVVPGGTSRTVRSGTSRDQETRSRRSRLDAESERRGELDEVSLARSSVGERPERCRGTVAGFRGSDIQRTTNHNHESWKAHARLPRTPALLTHVAGRGRI